MRISAISANYSPKANLKTNTAQEITKPTIESDIICFKGSGDKLVKGGIGALLGGVIGFCLGGPLGAAAGATLGAGAANKPSK